MLLAVPHLAAPGIEADARGGRRYYDWERSGRRPWDAVCVRRDRRVVVATMAVSRAT